MTKDWDKISKDKKENKKQKRDLSRVTEKINEKNKKSEEKKRESKEAAEINVNPSESENELEIIQESATQETSFDNIKRNMWISEDNNIGYSDKEKDKNSSSLKKSTFSLTDHLKIGNLITGSKRKNDFDTVKSHEKKRKKNTEQSIVTEEKSSREVSRIKVKNNSNLKWTETNVSPKDAGKVLRPIDLCLSSGVDESSSSSKRNVIIIADDSEESDQHPPNSSLSSHQTRPPSSTPNAAQRTKPDPSSPNSKEYTIGSKLVFI